MNTGQAGQASGGGNSGSCLPLERLSPEEITLAATVFAIAISESLDDQDASLLASFLSTLASNIALFLQKRSQEQTNPIPGQ